MTPGNSTATATLTGERLPRRAFSFALVAGFLGGSGCAHYPAWRQGNPYAATARCVLQPGASPDELIRHINQNASSMTSWRATEARISSRSERMGIPMSIRATFAVEAPRSFRVVAYGPTGGAEVDFGSNEEECWFWAKRDERRTVMTCRHDRLEQAHRRLPIPIQPEWIAEVLGVMPIDAENLEFEPLPPGPDGRTRARFTRTFVTQGGKPLRRVIVVDACHGLVLEHALHDASDQPIARAVLSGHARVHLPSDGRWASSGPVLPARIDFEWPLHQMAITVQLGPVDINPGQSPAQFSVPDYKGHVRTDLGA